MAKRQNKSWKSIKATGAVHRHMTDEVIEAAADRVRDWWLAQARTFLKQT